MVGRALHLERLELAAKTLELMLADPTNNQARDVREAAQALKGDWHRFDEEPPPKGMFLWARQTATGWSLGLAYWTVSGNWRCAYGTDTRDATHWHELPEPPYA